MPGDPIRNGAAAGAPERPASQEPEPTRERGERGISDFVKRAMSAGLEVATKSKDDIVRVATNEMRSWLERMDLQSELVKALSQMVVEVKAEVRFRPREDGKVVPEATSDVKIRSSGGES